MGSQDPFADCHTGENRRKGARKETRGGEGRPGRGRRKKERKRERMASGESLTEHSVPAHPPNQFHFFLSNKTVGRTRSWLTGTREAAQPPGAQRPFLRLGAMASGTLQAPSHPKGPPVAVRASSCTGVSVCFRKENRPFTQPYPRRRPPLPWRRPHARPQRTRPAGTRGSQVPLLIALPPRPLARNSWYQGGARNF